MTQRTAMLVGLFERIPVAFVLLLARVVVGLVFYQSGLTKIDGLSLRPATFFLFENEFKVPLLPPVLAAYMAATAELTMPWLLWTGLGARFAAAALLGMTIVIELFVYPDAYITHGLWAVALLAIMKFGAGTVSVDHLIRAKFGSVPNLRESESTLAALPGRE
jgi:putative oxidoreductase